MTTFVPQLDVLPQAQQAFWPLLRHVSPHFILYGGTALALRLGHRQSFDFDFFSSEKFQVEELFRTIPWLEQCERSQAKPNTLSVIADKEGVIRLSFFGALRIGRVGEPQLTSDGSLIVAALLDLAATKVAIIQQRAEQKDYLDIAAILKDGISLAYALGAARALYPDTFNPMISLKALSYFEDGDLPHLPSEIKRLLSEAASQVSQLPEIPRVSDSLGLSSQP